MYNLKVKDYGNGQVQSALYSHVVRTGQKRKPEPKEVIMVQNPFNGEWTTVVQDFNQAAVDRERSIINSLRRAQKKIYDLSRCNHWDWFVTITFNAIKVDRYDYSACAKKLSVWLNHLQAECGATFRYLIVPERHIDGAYHFHGLFADCDALQMTFSGHSTKSDLPIYNIGKYRFGFTTATRVTENEAVTKYITKYVTKELMEHTKNKRKYWHSKNLQTPTEYTAFLDGFDLNTLRLELEQDDLQYLKVVTYEVNAAPRCVTYYENSVPEGTGTGYDMALFASDEGKDPWGYPLPKQESCVPKKNSPVPKTTLSVPKGGTP